MESRDSPGGEFHRSDLIWRELPPCLGSKRSHVDFARCLAVDPHSEIDETAPAAAAHLVDDRLHGGPELLILSLFRARKRGSTAGAAQLSPYKALHSIIFSMGTTRIADAPAAFRFCSVSQKTDSWQTA